MAKKQVIAYYMHENERNAAQQLMPQGEVTESFVMGEMDDGQIAQAKQQGLWVQETKPPAIAAEEQPTAFRAASMTMESLGVDMSDAVPAEVDYYYIRLRGPLLESRRARLLAMGIHLMQSDDKGNYKAQLNSSQVGPARQLDFVESVTWISPVNSAPVAATLSVPSELAPAAPGSQRTFDVRIHQEQDQAKVVQWLHGHQLPIVGASGRKIRFLAAEDDPLLGLMAMLPEVDVIAQYVLPEIFDDAARRLLGIEAPPAAPGVGGVATSMLNEDGNGQLVAIADTGVDDAHPDLQKRVVMKVARGRVNDTSDPVGHGTHVAGCVAGDGTANPMIKGTAPGATLYFQSLLDANGKLGGLPLDLGDLFDDAYQAGARIHNNSWGASTLSAYTFNSEEVDQFVRDHRDMLVVVAAGNDGTAADPRPPRPRKALAGFVDWLSINSPASCKNALTVGASRSDRKDGPSAALTWMAGWSTRYAVPPIANEFVSGDPDGLAAFSSRGPCDDRRIKPDLVAPGTDILSTRSQLAPNGNFPGILAGDNRYAFDNGTSMATPLASGCAALVRQYYVDTCKIQPSAALLKATLVNSTAWLPGPDADADTKGKPNYHQGHGRISMNLAIPNPSQPGMTLQFVDNWQTAADHFTRTGERRRYQFVLPATADLRFTLAYTDAPGRALQNNINMMVNHIEGGKKWVGNEELPDKLTLPDPDNNLESIRIANAPPGTYFIQVMVGNMLKPPQDFALVVTGVGVPALTQI
jgi:serine protease AprX